MPSLGETLADQLDRSLDTLEEAIRRCDEVTWRAEDAEGGWGIARQAYHAVESVDYLSPNTPEGFKFFRRLGSNWESSPAEAMPSREEVLAYLAEVKREARSRLEARTIDVFMTADGFGEGTGDTALGTALYNLRHLQHHVGQINLRLRTSGLSPAEWR
ncbi:MAG: DinB family protein [Dehalococcoidales bacterium]|nr:DinB family protein [Dehalococcoidales bacterium]